MMDEMLLSIAQLAPVVGVLVYFIWYFKGEIASKNNEIKELNSKLRETEREVILSMNKMSQVVQDLSDLIKERIK